MNQMIKLLNGDDRISDYRISIRKKESYELFFVKGTLETVRCTDTCDKEVTVYVTHGEFKGEAQFFVYPSTTEGQLRELVDEAVAKALLINNRSFELPGAETGSYEVESNFSSFEPYELAARIAGLVFSANTVENADINSLEIFLSRHTETICNSRGLHKSQIRYSAMVEAIPTYNGEEQSVELYEQYNFGELREEALVAEITEKMEQVKARYHAAVPQEKPVCPVIFHKEELAQLFWSIAGDLHYASIYSHSGLWSKGDAIQKEPVGDLIGITMAGEVPGCTRSAKFDADGMSLDRREIVREGKAVAYYGSSRYGQYLGEEPTGELRCICVNPGSASEEAFRQGPYLEILSMSGLQVDFYSDYIGGEIRLAYYHDGSSVIPVTGISVSGSLNEVLNRILLSRETAVHNGYSGPSGALLQGMKIF